MHEVHRRHAGRFRYSTFYSDFERCFKSVYCLKTTLRRGHPNIKIRKVASCDGRGWRQARAPGLWAYLAHLDDRITAPPSVVAKRVDAERSGGSSGPYLGSWMTWSTRPLFPSFGFCTVELTGDLPESLVWGFCHDHLVARQHRPHDLFP